MVACLLLGGGTSAGFLSDAIIQLLAIPLVLICVWRWLDLPADSRPRLPVAFCLALVLVPLVQLIPLPPAAWTTLPDRQQAVATFELLGQELPWMPLSVSPTATWLSALSLLPPIGIFLGTALLGFRHRRQLSLVVLAIGIVSVFVGLTQVAQGPDSALRFYDVTNLSEAVGFFANRNHFAAFLYCVTVLAAAWAVEIAASFTSNQRAVSTDRLVALVASFTLLVILVAAQAMARSRAGLGLTIVALLGGMALAFSDRRNITGVTPARLLVAAIALAAMFAAQFALYRILERFADDPLRDARITFVGLTMEAAKAHFPFGSGMGTFVPVYAAHERPEHALLDTFANRAHNDIAELALESGAVGLSLLAFFLIWLGARIRKLWRGNVSGAREIDLALARAAAFIVGLILAHSFVDYPLRTGSMMAVMAFACGLLVEAPISTQSAPRSDQEEDWEPAGPAAKPIFGHASLDQTPDPAAWQPPRAGERWGDGIQWPEQWRDPGGQQSGSGTSKQPPKPTRKP